MLSYFFLVDHAFVIQTFAVTKRHLCTSRTAQLQLHPTGNVLTEIENEYAGLGFGDADRCDRLVADSREFV